jgi:hypothetical protein
MIGTQLRNTQPLNLSVVFYLLLCWVSCDWLPEFLGFFSHFFSLFSETYFEVDLVNKLQAVIDKQRNQGPTL